PGAYGDLLATDLLAIFDEAAVRTDQGLESGALTVCIGYQEQYTRGVLHHDGWNFWSDLLLFTGITTEDQQIGHTGPHHRRPPFRRFRVIPEAGECLLDGGQFDRLRGMGNEGR